MRAARAAALGVLALCGAARGHFGGSPDPARLADHHRRLSEACLAKGRTLQSPCPLDPESTEGPYVFDEAPVRANMTEDRAGVPFEVRVTVVNSTTCEEIEGAAVEYWHCDAAGLYSHFIAASTNQGDAIDNSTFLRGIQFTDDTGTASMLTIFPGWYRGRTTHIHVRVHFNIDVVTEADGQLGYDGGTVSHVGQLYFGDEIVDYLANFAPYNDNLDTPRTPLLQDGIFTGQGGDFGLMELEEMFPGEGFEAGIIGTVVVGTDTIERGDGEGGDGPGGPGGPGDPPDGPGGPGGPPNTTDTDAPTPAPSESPSQSPTPGAEDSDAPSPAPTPASAASGRVAGLAIAALAIAAVAR